MVYRIGMATTLSLILASTTCHANDDEDQGSADWSCTLTLSRELAELNKQRQALDACLAECRTILDDPSLKGQTKWRVCRTYEDRAQRLRFPGWARP